MRPRKTETDDTADRFRAPLEQAIHMRHELLRPGSAIDWERIDEELLELAGQGPFGRAHAVHGRIGSKSITCLTKACEGAGSMSPISDNSPAGRSSGMKYRTLD